MDGFFYMPGLKFALGSEVNQMKRIGGSNGFFEIVWKLNLVFFLRKT
jgi:hypothetical protein